MKILRYTIVPSIIKGSIKIVSSSKIEIDDYAYFIIINRKLFAHVGYISEKALK